MPVIAIKSGGDWADSSVNFVVLPKGNDIDLLHREYQNWYQEEFLTGREKKYRSFSEWLIEFRGAVEPTEDQLIEFWDE